MMMMMTMTKIKPVLQESQSKDGTIFLILVLVFEGVVNDVELADEGVEEDDLVVAGVGCCILVIRRQL